jgi:16S rRNA U1498 N3-methylase RsmE
MREASEQSWNRTLPELIHLNNIEDILKGWNLVVFDFKQID